MERLVHEDSSDGVNIEPVRCPIRNHGEELTYLYTRLSPGMISPVVVLQCPKTKDRWAITQNENHTVKRSPRPKNGWAPIKLQDGRVVRDSGSVSKADQTEAIPEQDPWPALAAEQYKLPTKFQGSTSESMGF